MIRTPERSPICPPKPSLEDRALIGRTHAAALEELFKILANDTRLRLIHALARSGEMRLTDVAAALRMKPQAVSNQLQRLAGRGIVASRREGSNALYRIADPCVTDLLDRGLCLLEDARRKPR